MAPGLDWRLWHTWEEDSTTGEPGEGGRTELDRRGGGDRGWRGQKREGHDDASRRVGGVCSGEGGGRRM